MKKMAFYLILSVLLSPAISRCEEAPGAVSFIQDAVKNAESDMALNLHGDKFGALYVPLRVLDFPVANSLDGGAGAVIGAGTPEGLISARLNIPQLINGLCGTSFFTKYTHGIVLPTLFLGPAIKAEFPPRNWTWRKDTYLLIGIPFGSVFH